MSASPIGFIKLVTRCAHTQGNNRRPSAAFVGREYSCNCTKGVCAVPNKGCLEQIQATLCSVNLFANLAVALTGLTQLFLQ